MTEKTLISLHIFESLLDVHTILFLCCNSSSYVRLYFRIWRLFYHYLFLISLSFGARGVLCYVVEAFSGILTYIFVGNAVPRLKLFWSFKHNCKKVFFFVIRIKHDPQNFQVERI